MDEYLVRFGSQACVDPCFVTALGGGGGGFGGGFAQSKPDGSCRVADGECANGCALLCLWRKLREYGLVTLDAVGAELFGGHAAAKE